MIPAVKPVLRGLTTDEHGRLWMTVLNDRGPGLHVFDSTGRWIARARLTHLPDRGRFPVARNSRLYVITRDELDVPLIVRYHVALPANLPKPRHPAQ